MWRIWGAAGAPRSSALFRVPSEGARLKDGCPPVWKGERERDRGERERDRGESYNNESETQLRAEWAYPRMRRRLRSRAVAPMCRFSARLRLQERYATLEPSRFTKHPNDETPQSGVSNKGRCIYSVSRVRPRSFACAHLALARLRRCVRCRSHRTVCARASDAKLPRVVFHRRVSATLRRWHL